MLKLEVFRVELQSGIVAIGQSRKIMNSSELYRS